MEWQPIETAPKNGEWVLLYFPHYAKSSVGKWRSPSPEYYQHWCIEGGVTPYDPTHWMPLPQPPKEEQ